MSFLSEPLIWTIIGTIAAVIVIPVTIWLTLGLQKRKLLMYQIIDDITNQIEHSLSKEQVIFLKILNCGNIAIKIEDFDPKESVNFEFEESRVLEVEVVETSPKVLKTKIEQSLRFVAKSLSFDPVALNPKDFIKLKVVTSAYPGKVSLESFRIIDGKIVDWSRTISAKLSSKGSFENYAWGIGFLSLFISVVIVQFISNALFPPSNTIRYILYLVAFPFTVVVFFPLHELVKKMTPNIRWDKFHSEVFFKR